MHVLGSEQGKWKLSHELVFRLIEGIHAGEIPQIPSASELIRGNILLRLAR